MTAMLQKAFAKASKLTESAQEQLAQQLLTDIGDELKWDKAFDHSQDLLEAMAAKARQAKRRGKICKKGFDEL